MGHAVSLEKYAEYVEGPLCVGTQRLSHVYSARGLDVEAASPVYATR
jgi:hypothetical protein